MSPRLQLIFTPAIITLAATLIRFVMEAVGVAGSSVFNISLLIPVFAVYFTVLCLRQGMGYGGFMATLLLYTLAARLPVLILSAIGQTTGLGNAYFAYRNVLFGLLVPHLIVWPVVTFIAGTVIWPIVAVFSRRRRVSYRGVAASVIVVLLIIFVGFPYAISVLYTSGSGRRTFQDTPAKYGMAFEDITLAPADGLSLQGWYLPAPEGRGTVIFCHGLFNQRGEMLDQAVFMRQQGYSALLFDFRHHGRSEGAYTTFGYYERQDVEAALRYVTEVKNETGPVILWGISMGAANALLEAADQPRVSAVIAESSFYSVHETLQRDLSRMFRLPVFPFAMLVEKITELRLGIHIDDLDVGKAVARLQDRPVLLVGGTEDTRMPIQNNERLFAAIPGDRKDQWAVQGAGHADAWRMARDEYQAKVTAFLDRYLGPAEAVEPVPAPAASDQENSL